MQMQAGDTPDVALLLQALDIWQKPLWNRYQQKSVDIFGQRLLKSPHKMAGHSRNVKSFLPFLCIFNALMIGDNYSSRIAAGMVALWSLQVVL